MQKTQLRSGRPETAGRQRTRMTQSNCFLFLFFLFCATTQGNQVFETVYPERLDRNRSKRDLSTSTSDGHEDSVSFAVKGWVLDANLNNELVPSRLTVRQFHADWSDHISQDAPDNCHYQGSIRGVPHSTVLLSTCEGLRGIVDDGKNTFHIEPLDDHKKTGAHKLYNPDEDNEFDVRKNCGFGFNVDLPRNLRDEAKSSNTRKEVNLLVNTEERYRPYLTTNQTRYAEVLFVIDHGLYKRLGSDSKVVIDRILTVCNAVDAIYRRINIRIVMSAIEIWTNGDRITTTGYHSTVLNSFIGYINSEVKHKIPHDMAHLLANHVWDYVVGIANFNTMCWQAYGQTGWYYTSNIGPYSIVAHEMGHNFGFGHDADGPNCKCLSPQGCFMRSGHKPRLPGFSNCSLNALKRTGDWCMYNKPKALVSQCGNGIQEGDEECDCGTPEMCEARDSCCQPFDCRLKPGNVCSDLHHSCCKDCQYKRQGTLCRAAQTDCDVPEYCPGDSRDCPQDAVIRNGFPCNRTNKLLVGNANRNSVVARTFSPRIEARYVRITPQYWKNRICMRVELYGCSADEVHPTSPTPLRSYDDYCIIPKDEKTTPAENSGIIFRSANCKKDYMNFRLDANGVLWHHSSGRRVCPEHAKKKKRARLIISSACDEENSKFARTSEFSLKHVKTGRCIIPRDSSSKNNTDLLVYKTCDRPNQKIFFDKTDCVIPLGMSTHEIPDDHITGSSSHNGYYSYKARLYSNEYWCAGKRDKKQYLQIDLGKIQTISKIATQGRITWNEWVTGYFVEYSQDGQTWTGYSESGDTLNSNSYCFLGNCIETRDTQCRDLWGADSKSADHKCYGELNTEAKGFGTCNPASNSSCAASDVTCGQIQCLSNKNSPIVNYGQSYQKLTLQDSTQCSAAVLKTTDALGFGMVKEGTKCGDQKLCHNYQCKTFTQLDIQECPKIDGKECNGNGICTSTGVCHCNSGYDPGTACAKVLLPRDGNYGDWTTWSECTAGCGGGKQIRYRLCNNPFPAHGGKDCQGEKYQERECNKESCPKAISCRHLQAIAASQNKRLPDGIYKIYPQGMDKKPLSAYCDMSHDGGGWTLLVTSRTNTWKVENVRLRNKESPSLTQDYSMLHYADDIKNNVNVDGDAFEYRLEAQNRGRWGGIWRAERTYTFTATNNKQTSVRLTKKFDNWSYSDYGIEKRMPWISGTRLTTSWSITTALFGTITGDGKSYIPAPWISGNLMEDQPEIIWYWMREGPWKLPRSCMEVQMRGYRFSKIPIKSGIYSIKPPGKKEVKTYCDLTSNGGGWTLLATSKSHTGWTADNVKERNTGNPSLDDDYSILGVADAIKDFDVSQDFFQYRIEADGFNQYGGIFDAPREYTFTSTYDKQTNIKLVESFGEIGNNTNLATRMPRLGMSSDIFLSTGSTSHDASGTIVYNDGSPDSPSYLPSVKPYPVVIRYWMREGTRRSCNDLKVHGSRFKQAFKDGIYLVRIINESNYFPVYCDMTTDPGAYTLVVTSRHNNWTRKQVPARNVDRPSISEDYSILKYADQIKNLGHNKTFKYKLEASTRGQWGGIFSAPHEYSFMFTSTSQTGVTLLQKFGPWTFLRGNGLNNRMPWFDAYGTSNKALLTTSPSTTYYPSGSIIWGDTDRWPAEWMRYGNMINPGIIWYWVNEDDCDSDRQPVNGGISEWGSWTKCDKICANGKQRRYKTCINPEPRCGGAPCDPSTITDEKDCFTCRESPIRSQGGYYIQPKSSDCNPVENTTTWSHSLVFHKSDQNYSADYMKFVIDDDGIIYHKCSGKVICPEGNWPGRDKRLLLKSECPDAVSMHTRLSTKSLQNKKTGKCAYPKGGYPRENTYLVYSNTCNKKRQELDFFKLGLP